MYYFWLGREAEEVNDNPTFSEWLSDRSVRLRFKKYMEKWGGDFS
jgi:hypothetical protein